jgi:hypothetical protein
MQPLNGRVGCAAVRHFHEAKAPRPASVAVNNELDLLHRSIGLKELADIIFRGSKRDIPDINIHAGLLSGENVETADMSSEQYA